MAVVPREIRVKFLACQFQKTGDKCGEILAKCFTDFRPSISRDNGGKIFHTNSSTHKDPKFHRVWTKILSRYSGSQGPTFWIYFLTLPPSWRFVHSMLKRHLLKWHWTLSESRECPQYFRARQRSGEGVVRRNGCPKGPKRVFLESPFLLCTLKVCSYNTWKP